MPEHPRLLVRGGPADGREISLNSGQILLGRAGPNTITISWDSTVSRQHARIVARGGLLWLEDLNSSRGTFLQTPPAAERQLEPKRPELLLDEAIIRLGLASRFQVRTAVRSRREAAELLYRHLERSMQLLRAQLPLLEEAERRQRLAQVERLQRQVAACRSGDDLLALAAEGLPAFAELRDDSAGATAPRPDELPPLPDHLPDPGTVHRLRSILNVFIADVGDYVDDQDQPDDD